MVFQNYALYQHMTVYDNLAFGLRNRRLGEDHIKRQIDHAVEILGIGTLLQRKPKQLSGGQQQRVALAAAWCAIRQSSCSTSRFRISMPSCGRGCASNSRNCARAFDHVDLCHARPG